MCKQVMKQCDYWPLQKHTSSSEFLSEALVNSASSKCFASSSLVAFTSALNQEQQ